VGLDDLEVIDAAWSGEPVPPTSVQWFDRGPVAVRGGRHTLSLVADADASVDESNEGDNEWSGQYVWSPLPLVLGVPVVREEPPPIGYMPFYNCDGMTFDRNPSVAWVVGLTPLRPDDDYDVVVYEDYVGSQDGFDDQLGWSIASLGETDFMVGHYLQTPTTVFAGVINGGAVSHEPFAMEAMDANGRNGLAEASYPAQHMAPYHMVDVYEIYVEGGQRILFKLRQFGGTSDLELHLFPGAPGGIYGRWDPHFVSTPFAENEDWLVFEADGPEWYPLVVCRKDYRGLDEPLEYDLIWHPTAMSAVEEETPSPTTLMFMAPSPNPSSQGSSLSFALPRDGRVCVDVFDLRGRRVQTVVDREYPTGRHQVRWGGRDDHGRQAATGVYYARLQFAGKTLTRRMTVLR
jgi:hypothetical protein